jgi:hypothetical protein
VERQGDFFNPSRKFVPTGILKKHVIFFKANH